MKANYGVHAAGRRSVVRHPLPVVGGVLLLLMMSSFGAAESNTDGPRIRVGSKAFTEAVVLGEIVTQLAESAGAKAVHRRQLGGTQVLWQALLNGEIAIYAEYTGTIAEEIFSGREMPDEAALRTALRQHGVKMSQPLGFNNTYALGMKRGQARRLGIRTISDLAEHPDLRFGFSNEFLQRGDGWPHLQRVYQLPQQNVRGLDHDLAYRGLENGAIDVIDLYSTDAEIAFYNLRVLKDDRGAFPPYQAVLLYRDDLRDEAGEVLASITRLQGTLDEEQMRKMNARVKLQQVPEARVASDFLQEEFGLETEIEVAGRSQRLLKSTREHLWLVAVSMTAAILLAIPLGILAAKQAVLGQAVLAGVGILQTIPSLALFVILIPVFGLGAKPAICALFLYSLLPIVRNTYAGLKEIPRELHESAEALGLPAAARLRLIELPLAGRSILAGIKTSVVINVGTATLAGLIGAGGYGDPILTGIRLARNDLILEGAVPAALMALAAQGLFELLERRLVPKGLRLK